MKKPFCLKCEKRVDYVIKEEMIPAIIKGKAIEFKSKSAYCKKCGEYVFVEEIEDDNSIRAREYEDVTSVEQKYVMNNWRKLTRK